MPNTGEWPERMPMSPSMVFAMTMDGDIGILSGHSPVFGILSAGSMVRIREIPGKDSPGDEVRAAVRDGFLSVTDNRVSILASAGQLAGDVDVATVQVELDTATTEAGSASAVEESAEVRYARARLRAAGEQS